MSSAFNILANLLSFVSSLILAYYFGAQINTDVYFFCISGLFLLSGILVSSLNSSVVIPQSMSLAVHKDEKSAMQFLNLFLYGYVTIGAVLAAGILWSPGGLLTIVSNFPKSGAVATSSLVALAAVALLLMLPSLHLTDILVSRRFFTLTAQLNSLNSIIVVIFIFVFHGSMDIGSAMLGLAAAYFVQLLVLIYIMLSVLHWDFTLGKMSLGNRIWKNLLFTEAGYIASNTANYMPMPILSGFGAGVISSFGFAQRVINIPGAFVLNQVTSVIGIKFNELAAKREWKRINEILEAGVGIILFALIPLSGITWIHAKEIIVVLFHRGAFDEQGVENAAAFLRVFAWLPPLLAVNSLCSRVCVAGLKVFVVSTFQAAANILLILIMLVGVRLWGPTWCAVALLATYGGMVVTWYFLLGKLFPALKFERMLKDVARIVAINAPTILFVLFLKGTQSRGELVSLCFGVISYTVCILILARGFKLTKEINSTIDNALKGALR